MHQRYRLLRLLANGRFHSGEELGAALGIGRSAVWKLIRSLRELDLDVYAVSGKGYRLGEPLALLERERILGYLPEATRDLVGGLDIHASIDSTNHSLMQRAGPGLPSGFTCLAEHQSQGRGRRGRSWVSPLGANIYLSVLWRFDMPPDSLASLSLAAAVAVARGLHATGIDEIGLKWPNDVLWNGRKLAGILLEMAGEPSGPCHVVVGVGLNVNMPPVSGGSIDQPWVDVRSIIGRYMDRNPITAHILASLVHGFTAFATSGLETFRRDWERRDVLRGRAVFIDAGKGPVHGAALGLDSGGALLVTVDGETRHFHSGEVSVRIIP